MSDAVIITLIISVIVIGIVAAIVQHFRHRNMEWTGTVVDKDVREQVHSNTTSRHNRRRGSGFSVGGVHMNSGGNHVTVKYHIRVQIDQGKEIRWPISEGLYQQININDRIKKDKGTKVPRIIKSAAPQQQAAQAMQQQAQASTPGQPTQFVAGAQQAAPSAANSQGQPTPVVNSQPPVMNAVPPQPATPQPTQAPQNPNTPPPQAPTNPTNQ